MTSEIKCVLEKLHRSGRLEIEGLNQPSIEAQYLGYFSPQSEKKKAVYVLRNFYDESGGDSDVDIDFVQFSRSDLEELIKQALESEIKMATVIVKGRRKTHREIWHHYSGYHFGGPSQINSVLVRLTLKMDEEPSLLTEILDEE